jgi:hypothetical protein
MKVTTAHCQQPELYPTWTRKLKMTKPSHSFRKKYEQSLKVEGHGLHKEESEPGNKVLGEDPGRDLAQAVKD